MTGNMSDCETRRQTDERGAVIPDTLPMATDRPADVIPGDNGHDLLGDLFRLPRA
jgi:hypothetical protein